MKKISILISIIITVVIFSSCNNAENKTNAKETDTISTTKNTEKVVLSENDITYSGKIAYIRTDSLLLNYKYHKKIQEAFIKKTNRLDKELKDKGATFQKDAYDFQVKQANGSFLSQESYQAQGQELAKREQDLMALNERYSAELAQEQADLDKLILDSVTNILEIFNKKANYDYILRKDFILYGKKGFDITATITELLNKRYDESLRKQAQKVE